MAKIIKFGTTINKPGSVENRTPGNCRHKHVIAFTVYRTVRCAVCGIELDPFDVLVDILQAQVPENDPEARRFLRETQKRGRKGRE